MLDILSQVEIPTQTGVDMLTAAGVAVATAILIQLIARPIFKLIWSVSSSSELDEPKEQARYSLALNVSTLVVAVILAIVAQALFPGLTYATAFEGVLVAIFGAAGAIGLGEVVPNFVRAFKES